jgi:hypothetical protein
MWQLWRMQPEAGDGRAAGYLVTDGGHSPRPIAFVAGVGAAALRTALAIRRDNAKAAAARDLRRVNWRRLPKLIVGRLMFPVDTRGRVIVTDRTFAAGMYMPQMIGGRLYAFLAFTHAAVPQQKSGTSARPIIPLPASVKDDEARSVTAS